MVRAKGLRVKSTSSSTEATLLNNSYRHVFWVRVSDLFLNKKEGLMSIHVWASLLFFVVTLVVSINVLQGDREKNWAEVELIRPVLYQQEGQIKTLPEPKFANTGLVVNMFALVLVFTAFTGLMHVIYAMKFRKYYNKNRPVEFWPNKYRWLEYSVSASAMTILIVMLSGCRDINSITILVIATVMMMLTGYLEEKAKQRNEKFFSSLRVVPQIIGWFMYAIIAYIAIYYLTAIDWDENENREGPSPQVLIGMCIGVLVFYGSFGLVPLLDSKKRTLLENMEKREQRYVILSFVSKAFLALYCIFGVLVGEAMWLKTCAYGETPDTIDAFGKKCEPRTYVSEKQGL